MVDQVTISMQMLGVPFSPFPIVILIQAENEYSASANNSPYMQAVIDTYRAEGIVIRKLLHITIHRVSQISYMPQPLRTMTNMLDKRVTSVLIFLEPDA